MDIIQIIGVIILLAFDVGAFVISYLQFKEKGFLFNNAYLYASQEERKQMDENKERKKPYYRQSGFAFMFIGMAILVGVIYIVTDLILMYIACWAFIIIAVIYAIVSSIQVETHKS